MKKEQGFSLIELLIVVAIIAIIAAIAVPSMLTSRMAANEAGAIQGCRTAGSAEAAFAAVNNQTYTTLANLVAGGYLDSRFNASFNGYAYADGKTINQTTTSGVGGFGIEGTPTAADSTGRYIYGIAADQVVRYEGLAGSATAPKCGTNTCNAGDPIGLGNAASGS